MDSEPTPKNEIVSEIEESDLPNFVKEPLKEAALFGSQKKINPNFGIWLSESFELAKIADVDIKSFIEKILTAALENTIASTKSQQKNPPKKHDTGRGIVLASDPILFYEMRFKKLVELAKKYEIRTEEFEEEFSEIIEECNSFREKIAAAAVTQLDTDKPQ